MEETTDSFEGMVFWGAKTIKNVLYKIAVPSVIFSLLEVYPKRMVRGGKLDLFDFVYETIGGGTYWFTSALVVAEVLIICMMMASRSKNIWFYVICCTLLSYLGTIDSVTGLFLWKDKYLWFWGSGLTSLVFLAMGGVYWKYEKNIRIGNFGVVFLVVIWALCIYIWDKELKFTPFNRWLNIRGVFVGGLASFLLVCICKKLLKVNFLNYIGNNSIGFYFFSGAIPTIYSVIYKNVSGDVSLLGMFAIYIASILSSFILVYFINHFCPFLFDLRRFKLKYSLHV